MIDAIWDFDQMPWLVTRYAKEIAVGDGVLIWLAGKDAGIYAIAEVIEPAQMLSEVPDIGYWIDKSRLGTKPQARIRFTSKLIEKPILRVSFYSQNTNYKYTFQGNSYYCGQNRCWKTTPEGMDRLAKDNRIYAGKNTLKFIARHNDFPYMEATHVWEDTM